jgi:hypothetical protein
MFIQFMMISFISNKYFFYHLTFDDHIILFHLLYSILFIRNCKREGKKERTRNRTISNFIILWMTFYCALEKIVSDSTERCDVERYEESTFTSRYTPPVFVYKNTVAASKRKMLSTHPHKASSARALLLRMRKKNFFFHSSIYV